MKKLIALCLAMMFVLAGCSGRETAKKATENALQSIKNMDTVAMTKYFGFDILNSSEEANKIKVNNTQEFMTALVKNFSYEIVSVQEANESATAKLKLTNINIEKIMEEIIPKMIEEAFANAFMSKEQQLTEEETNKKFETMFMEAIGKPEVELTTVEIETSLAKKDGAWTISATDTFFNAVMGGMASAAEAMDDLDNVDTKPTPEKKNK